MYLIGSIGRCARRLRRDIGGLALLEFAFTLPIVLGLGAYGTEVAWLAYMNLRVSQIALALADNASRVGIQGSLSIQQLREVDVNDVLQAIRIQGQSMQLTTRGRVTLSSLENVQRSYPDGTSDAAPVQRIHWQRCIGLKSGSAYDSYYKANVSATDGSTANSADKGYDLPGGMTDGTGAAAVTAPSGSALMFVEINYQTQPLFGSFFMSPARIHYIASFIVRDRRDFSQLFNPTPAVTTANKSTCDLYAA
ncbi:TadE/TadG family type IV pilus assembly protein [uncultured Sphingomonas sp.]|uniref:TadE/TadG family type IV pilus assembly protein n=1 Tax=uncultured Sphingomonas sp. TaxID=158754 RepID=UPI0035CAB71E